MSFRNKYEKMKKDIRFLSPSPDGIVLIFSVTSASVDSFSFSGVSVVVRVVSSETKSANVVAVWSCPAGVSEEATVNGRMTEKNNKAFSTCTCSCRAQS